jgi:hypothetical protein
MMLVSWRDSSAGARSCTGSWARSGDFRRGSLNEVRRKCGKPGCACAAPDHPGHGPQWNLTRKLEGRRGRCNFNGQQIEKITAPTPVQARAFELLGSPVPVRLT